jgi:hypothetical protein
MHTIRLHISDGTYDKLMWFLRRFDKSEIEIIQDDSTFLSTKEYLHNELDNIITNKATFISSEELDKSIENVISKYEN